jgi:deoxycytidylate deaminase
MRRNSRPSKDEYYLEIAKAVCLRSPCIRRQFGAIVVKDDVIVSTGYNGPARGVLNCMEVGCLKDELNLPHYQGYDWCLPPTEEVLTKDGYTAISKVKVGEEVLTHRGNFRKVTRTFLREASELVYIEPWGLLPVRLTPNHPVLAVKTMKCRYDSRIICKETCKWVHRSHCPRYHEKYHPEWIPAGLLKEGDMVVLPFDDTVKTHQMMYLSTIADPPCEYEMALDALNSGMTYNWIEENLGINRSTAFKWYHGSAPRFYMIARGKSLKYGHSWAKSIPAELELDRELLRLFGFYLAEGCSSGNQVTFTFGAFAHDYIEEVKRTMSDKFGLKPYEVEARNSVKLRFSSVILAKLFGDLFGKDCYSKRIPGHIMTLLPELQAHILDAHAAGDGHFGKNGEVRITTASKELAFQIVQIMLRLRLTPIIDTSLTDHGTTLYRAIWSKNKSRARGYIKGNFFFVPVRTIRIEKYNGPVYNLEVSGDNSYVTKSFAVHNCIGIHAEENSIINAARHGASVLGGIMYLYGQNFGDNSPIEGKPCDRCKRAIINAGIKEVVTKKSDGSIVKTNVAEWVKEDTEQYTKKLEEARKARESR